MSKRRRRGPLDEFVDRYLKPLYEQVDSSLARQQQAEEWLKQAQREFASFTNNVMEEFRLVDERVVGVETMHRAGSGTSFTPHTCSAQCLPAVTRDHRRVINYVSPLTLPLIQHWRRIIMKGSQQDHRDVYYITPCGRRLRSMAEVQHYLTLTCCITLSCDRFIFQTSLSALTPPSFPFKGNLNLFIPDLSFGKERLPLLCVNWLSMDCPDSFQYTATRTAQPDVIISSEPEFMLSCQCEGDCSDQQTCCCMQLSLDEAAKLTPPPSTVSYQHNRLPACQVSAVYECNKYCSCSRYCGNRVVQHGPQHRMAVYRTRDIGWGLMTLDDIPQGAFICCYNGHIYSEQAANDKGLQRGDSYLAELDYIEVMEQKQNEQLESVCGSSEVSSLLSSSHPTPDDDDHGYYVAKRPRQCSSDSPSSSAHSSSPSLSLVSSSSLCSTRQYYYNEKHSYIIDAEDTGNMARFSNHSCSPNMFVQNVFVDTHDLRFPQVAFFSKCDIKAGSPLTWDYRYIVGSVEGRVLMCSCGEQNCRKRLL